MVRKVLDQICFVRVTEKLSLFTQQHMDAQLSLELGKVSVATG